MSEIILEPGRWIDGELPPNVRVGPGTIISGAPTFKRFRSKHPDGLVVGKGCTMDAVQCAVGELGRITIGDYCYLTTVVLLCEMELRIGDYVMIGWNVTIGDTDFHPIGPAERIADAIACSPAANGLPRPPVLRKPVEIGNNVWIGPNATILKGVRIGDGAFIEPGALVTHDVLSGARVMGNPAKLVTEA